MGGHRFRKLAIAATVAVALLAIAQATAATSAERRAVRVERTAQFERALLRAVNDVRRGHGVRPLKVSPGLATAARQHSRAMLVNGFFDHDSIDGTPFSERLKRTYPPRAKASWSVGENLFASTAAPAAVDAVDAWLASPGHRTVLLSPVYREIGIGVGQARAAGGTFGSGFAWVVTADFGARVTRG
jgi:uncharacterized protein YkwD